MPRGVCLSALPALLLVSNLAFAQAYEPVDRPKPDTFNKFADLRSGRKETYGRGTTTITEDAKAVIDEMAKWMVMRLADPVLYREQDGSSRETMSSAFSDSIKQLPRAVDPSGNRIVGSNIQAARERDNQLHFIREFGKAIDGYAQQALKHPQPIVRVNVARLLAELAGTGYYELADTCSTLLTDDAVSDAVKYYAAKSLGQLFSMQSLDEPENKTKSIFPRKEIALEAKAMNALATFITRRIETTPETPPQEIAGHHFVRREAIRALGLSRRAIARDGSAVLARPALVLMRVALQDNLTPPPDVSEQVEALIGFSQLTPDAGYNADAVAYGLALAAREVGRAFSAAQNRQMPIGLVPWKYAGVRLYDGLTQWKDAMGNLSPPFDKPKADLLRDVIDRILEDLADPLRKGGSRAQFGGVENLDRWLNDHVPADPSLFRGMADSAIKPPMPGEGT